ncbi:hypothetical protein [Marinobacter sp.]|uniref:hypothetical protein n=1 Tax=Marinobacter sp. TaxID=50741 RepID=UPI0035691E72
MDANYLYIPLSVDGVNGLESVLVHKDTIKQVIFKGCRVIESPLIPSSGSVELPPIEEGVVIQLMSKLKPDELSDLIDDNSLSWQQGYVLPMNAIETTVDESEEVQPVGAGKLIMAGTLDDDGNLYHVLSANMELARRYCRVHLLPEIIYDPEEALERFYTLRRELEIYLGYGVKKFTGFQSNYFDLSQDKLMKAVRLVEVVTEEKFPKFRDCLFEPAFRQDFLSQFSAEMDEDEGDGISKERGADLFILFCLIRDLEGTPEALENLPNTVPSALKQFLGRIVYRQSD